MCFCSKIVNTPSFNPLTCLSVEHQGSAKPWRWRRWLILQISAGELSLDPGTMKVQLSRVFQTHQTLECPDSSGKSRLISETRLEKRMSLATNWYISVFLGNLQYCDGIIFLTTNRVSDFDEAVLSRIRLMLRDHELGVCVGSQTWEHMLNRAQMSQEGAMIARKGTEHLAITEFNGRQVKFLCSPSGDFSH